MVGSEAAAEGLELVARRGRAGDASVTCLSHRGSVGGSKLLLPVGENPF
jgi:hypothetical protein